VTTVASSPTNSAIVRLPRPREFHHGADHQPIGVVVDEMAYELAVDLDERMSERTLVRLTLPKRPRRLAW
jgi:hypothetical protein